MEKIKILSVNGHLRAYNEEIQFRYTQKDLWQKLLDLTQSTFDLLSCSQKDELYHPSPSSPEFVCFYKKNPKIKIYSFNKKDFVVGGSSIVFFGYKLNGKSSSLKQKILKKPREARHQQNLIEEKNQLDNLLNGKKLDYIQEPFELFTCEYQIGREYWLIAKRYKNNLRSAHDQFTFAQKVDLFTQMVKGVSAILDKEMLTLDIKPRNMVYEEDLGNEEMQLKFAFIDLSPQTEKEIQQDALSGTIRKAYPMKTYTPIYVHFNDIEKLSNCFQKEPFAVSDYFKVGSKMMVYQIGISFFELLAKEHLFFETDLVCINQGKFRAAKVDDFSVKERIKKGLEPLFIDLTEYIEPALFQKVESLLLKMVKVNSEERISIQEALEELKQWQGEEENLYSNQNNENNDSSPIFGLCQNNTLEESQGLSSLHFSGVNGFDFSSQVDLSKITCSLDDYKRKNFDHSIENQDEKRIKKSPD